MSKKHSKILFCRFSYPHVEELATWEEGNKYINQAKKCIKLHNDTVIGPDGSFDSEFWFLSTKIKGETKIITSDKKGEFPSNDPDILIKLQAYLNKDSGSEGSAHSRAVTTEIDIQPLLKPTVFKQSAKDKAHCDNLENKLREKIGDKATITGGVEGKQYYVEVTSFILTRDEIFSTIIKIKGEAR